MNIGERIRELREILGLTQKEFGEKIGKSRNAVTNWEIGRRNIDETTIKLISKTFGISEKWLKTGEGSIFESNAKIIETETIPVVSRAGAGFPESVQEWDILYEIPVPKGSYKKGAFGVEVKGDSMMPTLEEGDIVICYPAIDVSSIPSGKIVVVATEEGDLIVKRLKRINNKILLTSDNPTYEPVVPNGKRIVGKAVNAIKVVKL